MCCLWTKVILWRNFSMASSIEDKLKQMPKKHSFFTPPTLCDYDITETSFYLKSFCYISKNWILYNRFFFSLWYYIPSPFLYSFLFFLWQYYFLYIFTLHLLFCFIAIIVWIPWFILNKPQHLELTDHKISLVSTYYK